jgi:glycine betaine/choline ABC-type transport system substrate-binding protein
MLLLLGELVLHCDEFHMVDIKNVIFCFVLTFSIQNAYKFREDILKALKKYYGIALSTVLLTL